RVRLVSICLLSTLVACSTVYYNFWDFFGKQKRDLLKDNVEEAREDQEAVAEEFENALEHLKALYGLDGGNLEKAYRRVSADYEAAESRAEELRNRIDKVDDIAKDLFDEWKDEAESFSNKRYKADSLAKLARTQRAFDGLLASLRKS